MKHGSTLFFKTVSFSVKQKDPVVICLPTGFIFIYTFMINKKGENVDFIEIDKETPNKKSKRKRRCRLGKKYTPAVTIIEDIGLIYLVAKG